MNKSEDVNNRFARLGLSMMIVLLLSRCGCLAVGFYALYFIGGGIVGADFYDMSASPLLVIIVYCWRKLNEIYEAGDGLGQTKTSG